MTTKVNRHVSFLPFCQVHKFGEDLNETHQNPSTMESMTYAAKWIQEIPERPASVWEHYENPTYKPSMPLTPLKRQPAMRTLAMVSRNPDDPMRKATIQLLILNKRRKMEEECREELKKKLRENHGILWTRPTALADVREKWRHSDEMESSGENPADTENNVGTPTVARKKKLLTRQQRFDRQVAKRKADWARKTDTVRKMNFAKCLKNFIEKLKMGVNLRSICSKDGEVIENDGYKSFAEMRGIFANTTRRGTRKMDFRNRASMYHRLANPKLEHNIRIAYEVILENYDSIIAPHLYYVFQTKEKKAFEALEKVFLLNY